MSERKTNTLGGQRSNRSFVNELKGTKPEDVAAKKRKKDTSTAQTQGSTWQPLNWREQLVNIREMRKTRDAPVDSQGCEKTADESQSPEVRGDKIGDPVGWGKGSRHNGLL